MESAVEQEYPHDDFPYQKITLLEYNQKAKGGKQQMAENNNNFKSTVEALFQGMDGVISSKTVVGDAIHVGDTIILPLVDLESEPVLFVLKNAKKEWVESVERLPRVQFL
jgi:hypothetical protein